MKKNFAAMAASLILLGLSEASFVVGQDYAIRETKGRNPYNLSALTVPAPTVATAPADPITAKSLAFLDIKMFKKFTSQFPEAKDAVWYRDGKRTHFYFHGDGTVVRAAMKENGDLLHMIRYYSADRLPKDVAAAIRNNYKGYRLGSVTEVTVQDKIAYIVVIEGIEDWLQIKFLEGEVTEFARFTY